MKAILFLITLLNLSATANVNAQGISLSFRSASLKTVLTELGKQTDYDFVYHEQYLDEARPVTIQAQNESIDYVLQKVFSNQPFSYEVYEKMIIIRPKPSNLKNDPSRNQQMDVHGSVTDSLGRPLEGVTVLIAQSSRRATTDKNGRYEIPNVAVGSTLVFRLLSYETLEVIADKPVINVVLKFVHSYLDETVVIAYGTTTKRLNTGSVSTVSSKEIERQPVSNPLQALYGKVPGLIVTGTNGLPGSEMEIQLRGQSSIGLAGSNNTITSNDPLFIIDGVPYAPNNSSIGRIPSATGRQSPFNLINPADIERIDVLKDADATAIYGSRGANGVILIQTKRGAQGKVKFTANLQSGWSTVTRTTDWLNTQQYVQMRKEAFENDGATMTPTNAYDILIWDTTRYTDFKKMLLENTANFSDIQMSVSGGSASTNYYIGAGYNRQTTVLPGDFSNNRASLHFSLNTKSANDRVDVLLTGSYAANLNEVSISDLSQYLNLPPNLPELYDDQGKLNWVKDGYAFSNPLADMHKKYFGATNNLNSSLQINYRLLNDLLLKSTFGYNNITVRENNSTPKGAQNPAVIPTGTAAFGYSDRNSIIVEPHIDYQKRFGLLSVNALVGGTWQTSSNTGSTINASGYTNDIFLESAQAAPTKTILSSKSEYKYIAIFGRLNLNYRDTYILNLTARRDGSSRFGPGKKFGNFGALGAAYIFTQEQFFQDNIPALSFGKLRGSYGRTGNDKIGDYGYMDTYTAGTATFDGNTIITPTGLSNVNYGWEVNKKLEFALELGFFSNKLLITTNYFQNISDNQLIRYNLPGQTGGSFVIANFPASVENKGVEFDIRANIFSKGDFSWNSTFNISLPKNKLMKFPDIESSSYNFLVIGKPLSIYGGYQFTGLNKETGLLEFMDGDGMPTANPVYASDMVKYIGHTEARSYGGLDNTFRLKNFTLSVLFEFRKQKGVTILGNMFIEQNYPGRMANQPLLVLDRWQSEGDNTVIPKYTTTTTSPTFRNLEIVRNYSTSYRYGDASYIRLKNLSFSYDFTSDLIKRIRMERASLFVSGQNLLLFTKYEYGDPETQTLKRVPPVKTITLGFKTNF